MNYCKNCGAEMDKDCMGNPRCPECDPPCPYCSDSSVDTVSEDELCPDCGGIMSPSPGCTAEDELTEEETVNKDDSIPF